MRVGKAFETRVLTVTGQRVLGQVVGADGEVLPVVIEPSIKPIISVALCGRDSPVHLKSGIPMP